MRRYPTLSTSQSRRETWTSLSLFLPCRGMIKLLQSRMRVRVLRKHNNGYTTSIYSMKTSPHTAFGQLNKKRILCLRQCRTFIWMQQITNRMSPSVFLCLLLLLKQCLEYSTTSCTPSTLLSSMVSSRSLGHHLYQRRAKFLSKNAETPPIFSCCVRLSTCIGWSRCSKRKKSYISCWSI